MAGFVNVKPLRTALQELQNILNRVANAVGGTVNVQFPVQPTVTASISGTPNVNVSNIPAVTAVGTTPMNTASANQAFNQFTANANI